MITSNIAATTAASWVAQTAGGLRSPLEPHPVSSVHAAVDPLSLLTDDDWQKISRALGRRVGPDAEGNPPSVTPVIAFMIAAMRQEGTLAPGAPVTAAALRLRYLGPDNSAGPTSQLGQLIQELTATESESTRLDITA
jgi:hypothetical protein